MNERRKYNRLEKEYRVEYGQFSALVSQDCLKTSVLKNLGSGGVLFRAEEQLPVGTQLLLRIYISGWSQANGRIEKALNEESEMLLKAIAEVVRVDFDLNNKKCYLIGAKFLGQVNN